MQISRNLRNAPLTCFWKIMQLFYSHFDAVNSFFLEQAIQTTKLVIAKMIKTGFEIPSDSANN